MNPDPINQRATPVPDRPETDDIIYGELNLERWPNIWNTSDEVAVRTLSKEQRFPDGSILETSLTIVPSPIAGDLTAETCKVFSVLLAHRQEFVGPRAAANIEAERIPMTLRKLAERLRPTMNRTGRWGGKQHKSLLKHLEKLNAVNLKFEGAFWNAETQRLQNFKGGFNLVSDYYVLEERRFNKGEGRQLPLELGYFRLNPFVIENLAMGYHAPFYLSERLRLSGFALVLYNQLDLKMASHNRYERDITELFESDFPEMGRKYPAPSQRERMLQRTIATLKDRRLTSGQLIDLKILRKKRGEGKKIVVSKKPFALRLIQNDAQPTQEQQLRSLLVDDILEVTHHQESTGFYHLAAKHLDEHTIRRFLSEIKADEAGEFEGTRGKLFFVKIRDYCAEQGIEPFWKAA